MCKLDPKVDLAFKKLFGSEENKDILMSLINSMLPKEEQMTEIILENPYNLPDYIKGKLSILDIKGKDEKGTWYDVEMQVGEQGYFGKRALFYWGKVYTNQIKIGKMFSKLKKTIMISILDFKYYDDKRFHRRIVPKDVETNELYEQLDYMELNFLELPKFEKKLKLLETNLERWITFFNHSAEYEKEKIPEELSKNPAIAKAIKQLDIMYFDKKEQEIYEGEQKAILDDIEKMRTAKAKGVEEGIEEGIEKGIEKERNIQEKKQMSKAKKMLKDGLSVNQIVEYTDLSKEEIEKLR